MKSVLRIGALLLIIGVVGYLLIPYRAIIVGVSINPPYQLETYLSPEEQTEQRTNIKKSTDKVVSKLFPGTYFNLKRFEFIPYFAITTNNLGYIFLLINPLVTVAEEDSSIILSPSPVICDDGSVCGQLW